MKKLIAGTLCLILLSSFAFADEKSEAIADAQAALDAFMQEDNSLAGEIDGAAGYAVFNKIGKGGLIIGGAGGKGVVYDSGAPVGVTSLTQVTIGFQAGGQTFSELIIFKTEQALRDFQGGNFALSAQATAVAATAGAAATAPYTNGVKIITMVKGGLMYEASVGGQQFTFERY